MNAFKKSNVLRISMVLVGLIGMLLSGCQVLNLAEVEDDHPVAAVVTPVERMGFSMNTPIRIRVFDLECHDHADDDERCGLIDEAFKLILDLEERLTVNDVGGEVEFINEMAGIQPVVVKADTFYLIEQAIHYSIYSNGLFNAVIGPLTSIWNISMDGARRPSDDEIAAVLPLLDPTRVVMDAQANTVFLEEVGMRLDLGAIAKGFMADEVAELFTSNGISRATIIIGGEVLAIGGNENGNPFRIGISSPFSEVHGHDLVGVIPAYNQAVVTSGTYNRYLAHQETNMIYHHIFDSRTGFPFDSEIVSITVVADTGLLGEVYTTIIFGMGLDAGMAYVEAHSDIEVMLITRDKGIYLSTGLQNMFELMSDDFEIRTP